MKTFAKLLLTLLLTLSAHGASDVFLGGKPTTNRVDCQTNYLLAIMGNHTGAVYRLICPLELLASITNGTIGSLSITGAARVLNLTLSNNLTVGGTLAGDGRGLTNMAGNSVDIRAYGGSTNGTDCSAAISNAMAALPRGGTISFPEGRFLLSNTVNIIDRPFIRLRGVGAAHMVYEVQPTNGTVLKWTGATNKSMILISASATATHPADGNGVSGIAFDGNDKADVGLTVMSSRGAVYEDLHFHEFRTYGFYICATNNGMAYTTGQDTRYENITARAVSTWASNGTCIAVGLGETNSNVSFCEFKAIIVYHAFGVGIDLGDVDGCDFHGIRCNRTFGTGYGMVLGGTSSTAPARPTTRACSFIAIQPVNGLIARGTTSFTWPSGPNYLVYSTDNSSLEPVVEENASLVTYDIAGKITLPNAVAFRGRSTNGVAAEIFRYSSSNEFVIIAPTRINTNLLISGRLGMGTNTPDKTISLAGTTPAIRFLDTANSRGGLIGIVDGFNTVIDNTTAGNVLLKVAGTTYFTVGAPIYTAPGVNFGVAFATPQTPLHVHGVSTNPSVAANNGIVTINGTISTSLSSGGIAVSPYTWWMQVKHTNNGGTFYPMSLNPLGGGVGVGLGTTNVVGTLHVGAVVAAPTLTSSSPHLQLLEETASHGMKFGVMTSGAGWIQEGNHVSTVYPLALNPLGGGVGIGTSVPSATGLDATGKVYGASAIFTNGTAMLTNYVAANFAPTAGLVKITASNNWLFVVTMVSTNPLIQIQP